MSKTRRRRVVGLLAFLASASALSINILELTRHPNYEYIGADCNPYGYNVSNCTTDHGVVIATVYTAVSSLSRCVSPTFNGTLVSYFSDPVSAESWALTMTARYEVPCWFMPIEPRDTLTMIRPSPGQREGVNLALRAFSLSVSGALVLLILVWWYVVVERNVHSSREEYVRLPDEVSGDDMRYPPLLGDTLGHLRFTGGA